MKKLLVLASLLLLSGLPAHAQFSRIIGITERQNDNSLAAYFASPFTIKAGANCSWSISGTTSTFNCTGPAGGFISGPVTATHLIYASGADVAGDVNQTSANKADCDGSMDPCDIYFTGTSTFTYFMAGTNTSAPMGNYFACANETDGGVFCNASDGTNNANMNFSPVSGATGMNIFRSAKSTGFDINSVDRVVQIGRLAFTSSYTTAITSGAFSLGAGWGSTASVTAQGGADNAFLFQITTGGAGIAANPTATYTYVDGDFSTAGSATPVFICQETATNDILADVTNAPTQTTVVLTWHGTPTTAKTYTISCIGFQRS